MFNTFTNLLRGIVPINTKIHRLPQTRQIGASLMTTIIRTKSEILTPSYIR